MTDVLHLQLKAFRRGNFQNCSGQFVYRTSVSCRSELGYVERNLGTQRNSFILPNGKTISISRTFKKSLEEIPPTLNLLRWDFIVIYTLFLVNYKYCDDETMFQKKILKKEKKLRWQSEICWCGYFFRFNSSWSWNHLHLALEIELLRL